jgi:hypothetical protein
MLSTFTPGSAGRYLVCTEIARHVRITLLDQQAAGSWIGDVFK